MMSNVANGLSESETEKRVIKFCMSLSRAFNVGLIKGLKGLSLGLNGLHSRGTRANFTNSASR
jgi:hypothetical protein